MSCVRVTKPPKVSGLRPPKPSKVSGSRPPKPSKVSGFLLSLRVEAIETVKSLRVERETSGAGGRRARGVDLAPPPLLGYKWPASDSFVPFTYVSHITRLRLAYHTPASRVSHACVSRPTRVRGPHSRRARLQSRSSKTASSPISSAFFSPVEY